MQSALTVERAQRSLEGDINPGDSIAFPLEDIGANGSGMSGGTGGIHTGNGIGSFPAERALCIDRLLLRTDGFSGDENNGSYPIETARR